MREAFRRSARGDRAGGGALGGRGTGAPAPTHHQGGRRLRVIVAVLDTNVLVAGFPARSGVPATLIDAWRQGTYQLVVSEQILEELAETWRDPYWQALFSPPRASRRSRCCVPRQSWPRSRSMLREPRRS